MADHCCGKGSEVMLLACSGGSNVGQLANQAAVELTREGTGKMFCLAGIGAHLGGFVQSAKDVPRLVAIDGCPVGCTKAILDHLGIAAAHYLLLTDLGIEKNKDFDLPRHQIAQVKAAVENALANGPAPRPATTAGGCTGTQG
jgi:uncharacterized metal-binding protein